MLNITHNKIINNSRMNYFHCPNNPRKKLQNTSTLAGKNKEFREFCIVQAPLFYFYFFLISGLLKNYGVPAQDFKRRQLALLGHFPTLI